MSSRVFGCIFLLVWTTPVCSIGQGRTVTGAVADEAARPVADLPIRLTSETMPALVYEVRSDASGAMLLHDVPPGTYAVSIRSERYTLAFPLHVTLPATGDGLRITIGVTKISAAVDPAPDPTSAAAAPPNFTASGLHGLIDPGGYSASTSDAASSLLRDMTTLQRTSGGGATALPCSAETALKARAALHPEQAETNLQLGLFYLAHREAEKALPYLTKAFDLDGKNAAALRALAMAYGQEGEASRALSLLHSVPPQGRDAGMHQALARAEEAAGRFAEAAQEYRLADAQQPAEASVFGAGYELILAGSVAESITLFQAGLGRYPQSIALRVGLGAAQLLGGGSEAGRHTLLDLADRQPEDPRPYPFLATTAVSAGPDKSRMLHSFERYVSIKPDSSDANYFYALALSREGGADSQKVVALLQRSLQLRPAFAKAHLLLGSMEARAGHDEVAAAEYEHALRLDPRLSEAHYRLALTYRRLGRSAESTRELALYRVHGEAQQPTQIAEILSAMTPTGEQATSDAGCVSASEWIMPPG